MNDQLIEIGERDGWKRHVDGFVKGDLAIFPSFFGSWVVHRKENGLWEEIDNPDAFVSKSGRTIGLSGWWVFWEKTTEQLIIEAKELSEKWK